MDGDLIHLLLFPSEAFSSPTPGSPPPRLAVELFSSSPPEHKDKAINTQSRKQMSSFEDVPQRIDPTHLLNLRSHEVPVPDVPENLRHFQIFESRAEI